MAIFVMLNNFFHDFSVALLFSSLLMLSFIYRYYVEKGSEEIFKFFSKLYSFIRKVIYGCWIFIVIGGIIRTINYYEYEWMEAAGKGQVSALVIKHILLVTLVVWGTLIQVKLKKKLISDEDQDS